jgi:hypothetical protein
LYPPLSSLLLPSSLFFSQLAANSFRQHHQPQPSTHSLPSLLHPSRPSTDDSYGRLAAAEWVDEGMGQQQYVSTTLLLSRQLSTPPPRPLRCGSNWALHPTDTLPFSPFFGSDNAYYYVDTHSSSPHAVWTPPSASEGGSHHFAPPSGAPPPRSSSYVGEQSRSGFDGGYGGGQGQWQQSGYHPGYQQNSTSLFPLLAFFPKLKISLLQ